MRSFEDYCWRDILSAEMVHIYSAYQRERAVSKRPALIVVHPPSGFSATAQSGWLGSIHALVERVAAMSLPIFHSVPADGSPFSGFSALPASSICLRPCDSAFLFTDLEPRLTRSGADGVIICGAPSSGAVRVTAVEAKSYGYRVAIAEETTCDEAALLHKIALFDVAHKYADVMSLDELFELINLH